MAKKARLKFKAYDLLRRAVDEGCLYASNRAFKHIDLNTTLEDLDRERLAEVFADAVMSEVCEVVDFEDDSE